MRETKTDFGKAIEGLVIARTREATRQMGNRFEHQLIGAFTRRPN